MGLSNAAKRARLYTSSSNRNQGGGPTKAGLPYQVGRTHWTPIFLQCNQYQTRCCKLGTLQITTNPNTHESKPIGTSPTISYWRGGANY